MRSQVSLSVDKPAVSPSYVFSGQHVPIVVRLVESLWAQGLAGNSVATGRSLLSGPELLWRDQLVRALVLLHADERCQYICEYRECFSKFPLSSELKRYILSPKSLALSFTYQKRCDVSITLINSSVFKVAACCIRMCSHSALTVVLGFFLQTPIETALN